MSSPELIVRYLQERARPSVFVPLAVVMAAVGRWTGGRLDGWTGNGRTIEFATAAGAAFALMLAFRVWDDLEDRQRDARAHPTRVTVVADSFMPLVALAVGLVLVGVSLVAIGSRVGARLGALVAAVALLVAWYRFRGADRSVVNGHVVLLKYPLIAFAATSAAPSFAALAALYLVLCVYEVFDDPELRISIVARRIAISECALVSAIIATATLFRRVP